MYVNQYGIGIRSTLPALANSYPVPLHRSLLHNIMIRISGALRHANRVYITVVVYIFGCRVRCALLLQLQGCIHGALNNRKLRIIQTAKKLNRKLFMFSPTFCCEGPKVVCTNWIFITETEKSSGWLPMSSLGMLKLKLHSTSPVTMGAVILTTFPFLWFRH